jgi:hypothetical protein
MTLYASLAESQGYESRCIDTYHLPAPQRAKQADLAFSGKKLVLANCPTRVLSAG